MVGEGNQLDNWDCINTTRWRDFGRSSGQQTLKCVSAVQVKVISFVGVTVLLLLDHDQYSDHS
jgi:hypothetical protein